MSDFASLLRQTREAFASSARLEAALMRDPGSNALRINLTSTRRMAERLESQLLEASKIERRDVCRYRLVRSGVEKYEIANVAKSLEKFQTLFTSVYDALTTQPKKILKISSTMVAETALDFGYSYPGSLGMVLTVPSDRTILAGKFDESIDALGQIFDIEDQDDVLQASKYLGNAVIKAAYEWSLENYKANFSVDINWKTINGNMKGGIIPREKMRDVVAIIDKTSEEEVDTFQVFGMLVGVDIKTRRFHFVIPDSEVSYRGPLSEDFAKPSVEVGLRYWATIKTKRVLQYATQTETVTHTLMRLDNDLVVREQRPAD